MPLNGQKIKKTTQTLQKFLTCTSDLRISWQIKEQNFTYFRNCQKMAKYYVNEHMWLKDQYINIKKKASKKV